MSEQQRITGSSCATISASNIWFIGSIMMTVLVPMVLYAINMLAGLQKKTEANNRMREQIYMNQIRDALKQREAQENAAGPIST